jgi:hypothetical protein
VVDDGMATSGSADDMLVAAATAPWGHRWDLRWSDDALEVREDPDRTPRGADPDGRALRLACGAALVDARTVARAGGHRAHVSLLPRRDDPALLGRVRTGPALPPSVHDVALAEAVRRRRTDRDTSRRLAPHTAADTALDGLLDGLPDAPLTRELRHALSRAARHEQAWMIVVDDPAGRRELRAIAAEAEADRPRGPDLRALVPTVAVVATVHDTPLAQLRAGMAVELVLLTATTRGVPAWPVTPPPEPRRHRGRVRTLVGGGLWPQALLRLGCSDAGGSAVSAARS